MANDRLVNWDGLVYYDEKIKDYIDEYSCQDLKMGGVVIADALPEPSVTTLNFLYIVTDDFVSDDRFEFENKQYLAGTVVYVADIDKVYKYRILLQSKESEVINNHIVNINQEIVNLTNDIQDVQTATAETNSKVNGLEETIAELEQKVEDSSVVYDSF